MSEEQKSEAISTYEKALREAKEARAPREKDWIDYYELYRSFLKKSKSGRSNLFIPYTFSLIETVLPRITRTLFTSRPHISVIPRNSMSVNSAPTMEIYLDYVWCERMNIPYHAHLWIKQALIYGYSPAKIYWHKDERFIKKRIPKYMFNIEHPMFKIGYGEEEVMQKLYDAPMFKLVDIFDFWVDPQGYDIESARYIIHRDYLTEKELRLREEQGLYKNVSKLIEQGGSYTNEHRDSRLSSIGLGGSLGAMVEGVYIVDEYWEDDRLIVVGNEQVELADGPNPFWHGKKPYVEIGDHPVPFETYTIGEIEPIRYLQHELNTMRNQRMDNVNMTINNMWLRRRNADIPDEDLVSRPNGIIDVDDINKDIKRLDTGTINHQSYMEEENVKKDIQNASGVFDHTRGLNSGKTDTATEVVRLQNAAEARFYEKVMLMENQGIRKLAFLTCALAQQFIVDEVEVPKITGDTYEFIKIGPEDIPGQYDFMTISNSMDTIANKDVKKQSMTMLYQMTAGDPLINRYEFLRSIFKLYEIREVDRIIQNPQQMMQQNPMDPTMQQGQQGGAETMNPAMTPLGGEMAYNHNPEEIDQIRQATMQGVDPHGQQ